jgi:hypothetical protein
MEKKYYSLGTSENNSLLKIIRIVFGVVCIAVAVYWLIFNLNSLKVDWTLWITIVFLTGFGLYQIWSGLGRAIMFVEIGDSSIRLKKNAILPAVEMKSSDIERIEIFPLNVVFILKTKKKIMLRFGTTYHDINEKILDGIVGFAESNNIPLEFIEEKIYKE